MKPSGKRRTGRELAVQFLFALDHNKTPLEEALPGFMDFKKEDGTPLVPDEKPRRFCEDLVRGVASQAKDIDDRIIQATANFNISRIGGVERAILRMAIYEMVHCLDVPPVVAINEALEIAKKFSGDEACSFINGVLDRVRGTLDRPARTATIPPPRAETYTPGRTASSAPSAPGGF